MSTSVQVLFKAGNPTKRQSQMATRLMGQAAKQGRVLEIVETVGIDGCPVYTALVSIGGKTKVVSLTAPQAEEEVEAVA